MSSCDGKIVKCIMPYNIPLISMFFSFHFFIIPESIAKGSSGKSFEHLHFDTHTHTHTQEERKHPSAKYASVKVCKCKYASMICKGEYASTQ